ncbi:MAG: hypothetical protein AB8G11_06145 [Saprospiraceae bacterium]
MKILPSLFLVFLFTTTVHAQEKVKTKYLRPSLTRMFAKPTSSYETVILDKFKELPFNNKVDNHNVDLNYVDYPALPVRPSGELTVDQYNYYKKQLEQVQNLRTNNLNQQLNITSREVMAKWWSRDANGNFNISLVEERGAKTIDDNTARVNKASATNRIDMTGLQLISKSYTVFYDITNVETMEQYYNRRDAEQREYARKNNKEFKPMNRISEGYRTNFKVTLYQLDFNDSIANHFYENYWSSAEDLNSTNIAQWNTATFPMKLVMSQTFITSSTQSKELKYGRKTMTQLLEAMPQKMEEQVMSYLSKKIDEFKVKAAVYTTEPLTSKIGTKEGVKLDQLYYIYEIKIDRKGNQKKTRKGAARVTEVANNQGVATGNSNTSTLQQRGGSKMYSGMLLEHQEDKGLEFGIQYFPLTSNRSGVNSVHLTAAYRLGNFVNTHSWLGIVGFGISAKNDINTGSIGYVAYGNEDVAATSMYALLAKEIFFNSRGTVYARPAIGLGLNNLDFSEEDDDAISAYSIPIETALIANITPNVAFQCNLATRILTAYYTDEDKVTQDGVFYDSGWGFKRVGKLNLAAGVSLGLTVRL